MSKNINLVYSIIKTPSNQIKNKNLNMYLYSDEKIHLKFNDFSKPQLISGFEQKCSYLITYLFNHVFKFKSIDHNDLLYPNKDLWEKYSFKFLTEDESMFILKQTLMSNISNCKGFVLLKNHKNTKNDNFWNSFGNIPILVCPSKITNYDQNEYSLSIFLETFSVKSLAEYLFDDSIEIKISYNSTKKFDEKFKTKQSKKFKQSQYHYDYNSSLQITSLWK